MKNIAINQKNPLKTVRHTKGGSSAEFVFVAVNCTRKVVQHILAINWEAFKIHTLCQNRNIWHE